MSRRGDRDPVCFTAAQSVDDALEEVHEALTAGVDDVAAGQDLELARGVGQGLAGRGEPALAS